MTKKEVSTNKIILLCLSDFSKGIFTGMIANYLIYFFLPTSESGIKPVISQGYVLFGMLTLIGLIKAVGHIIDAFTDPLIAHWSDRFRGKGGRRMPFMQWAAIPYGLCAFLIFCPPIDRVHPLNDIWTAVFIWLYFIFYTLYMIPHGALIPELIKDHKRRITTYSISAFFFVTGSALVYMAPLPVKFLKDAGFAAADGYRITFGVFTIIGTVLLLITAFCLKEKDYVDSKIDSIKLFPAVKAAFSNRHFSTITAAWLLEYTSMCFFQASILYYITILLKLPEEKAPIILGISILGSVILYPFVNFIAKKIGKKIPLISALCTFIVAYLIIFFGADWDLDPMLKGLMLALIVSYPFAALNIIPFAMISDVIHYDTIVSGKNREGIFSATRSFVTKIAQSIAIMIVPSVIAIGRTADSSVGVEGVKLTALIAACFCLMSIAIYLLYNDKEVTAVIEKSQKLDSDITDEMLTP